MKDFALWGHQDAPKLPQHKAPNSAIGRLLGLVYRCVCVCVYVCVCGGGGGVGMPLCARHCPAVRLRCVCL
jgi:hypothetical protein